MICPKCGFDNIEKARFCRTCGTALLQTGDQPQPDAQPQPQQETQPDAQPYVSIDNETPPAVATPWAYGGQPEYGGQPWYGEQPEKKAIKPSMIVIIAVIVAAVLVFVFVINPMLKPKNPMEELYDGIKGLMTSEGFDAVLTMTSKDTFMEADISYKLGSDLKSSIFDALIIQGEEKDELDWNRAIIFGRDYAYGSNASRDYGNYDYTKRGIADIDNYYRGRADDYSILDNMEEGLNYITGSSFNLNRLVSENLFDWERLWKYVDDGLSYAINDRMLDSIGLSSIPKTSSIRALFEGFIYNYCDDKDVVSKFAKDLTKKGNTYSFSYDMFAYLDVFGDYLSAIKDDEKALEEIGISKSEARAFEQLIKSIIPLYEEQMASMKEIYDSFDMEYDFPDIAEMVYKVEFTVNKGNLERIVYTVDYEGDIQTIELTAKNVNTPRAGSEDFEKFFFSIEEDD